MPLEPSDAGVTVEVIPSGRCARLRHAGAEEGLGEAISWPCEEWLPRSGAQRRHFPPFLQRVRFLLKVPAHEAVTDVFLPLE
jgi:AraC family transcriptional regulator